MSQHVSLTPPGFVPGTVFAIGRNYADHARELGNDVPTSPMFFLKASSCVVGPGSVLPLPPGLTEIHHEVELVVRLGKSSAEGRPVVEAYTVGIDLTDRVLQNQLKSQGMPWAAAKSFRAAAPVAEFIPAANVADVQALTLRLWVNGILKQEGDTSLMIHPVAKLVTFLANSHDLQPGDLIFTGTPSGVGPLRSGDRVEIGLFNVADRLTGTTFTVA